MLLEPERLFNPQRFPLTLVRADDISSHKGHGSHFDLFGFQRIDYWIDAGWDARGQRQAKHTLVRVSQTQKKPKSENSDDRNIKYSNKDDMLTTSGKSFNSTVQRSHSKHCHQDSDIRQDDKNKGSSEYHEGEKRGCRPLHCVIVTGKSEHRCIVTEIAEHSDRFTK